MFHVSRSRSEFAERVWHSRECRQIFLHWKRSPISLHCRWVVFCNTSRLYRRQERKSTKAANKHQRSFISSNKRSQSSSSSKHRSSWHQTAECFDIVARSEKSCSSTYFWLWIVQENERRKSFVFKAIWCHWNWRLDCTRNDKRTSNGKRF